MDLRVLNLINRIEASKGSHGLSLRELSGRIGLSERRLATLFKKATGLSFQQYLRQVRLTHATRFLADTDLRIKQVADEAGFTSTSSMDKDFRREFGLSPGQYRAKVHKSRSHE